MQTGGKSAARCIIGENNGQSIGMTEVLLAIKIGRKKDRRQSWLTASLWPQVVKFDLFANYRFNDRLKVGIYLANATDQMDATTTTFGYNFHPGRTLTANLEYRF